MSDQLGQLKNFRLQADYVRDNSSQKLALMLRNYSATNWHDLANAAMALASQLLPSVNNKVPRWP
jgi:hypothetical protein